MFITPSLSLQSRRLVARLSIVAVVFNIYLATILKLVLKEWCIVCVANYAVNGGLFVTVRYLARDEGRNKAE